MIRWKRLAEVLRRRDEAATMVEYTFLMMLIASACAVAVSSFGSALLGLFNKAVNAFPH